MFHMYDRKNYKCDDTSSVANCHTFSDPLPLERDVVYGRPQSVPTTPRHRLVWTGGAVQTNRRRRGRRTSLILHTCFKSISAKNLCYKVNHIQQLFYAFVLP